MTHSTPAEKLRDRHDPCTVAINYDQMLQLLICISELGSISYIKSSKKFLWQQAKKMSNSEFMYTELPRR